MKETKESLYKKKESKLKIWALKVLSNLIDGPDYLVRVIGIIFLTILGFAGIGSTSLFLRLGESRTYEISYPVWLGCIMLVLALLGVVKGFREDWKLFKGFWNKAKKKSETPN